MTSRRGDAHRRWLGFLLAALVTVFGAGTASAATATAAQTRVGPQTLVAPFVVGPRSGIGAGQRLGIDLPAYDLVLASGVAADGVSRLVPGGGLAGHEAAGGHVLARHIGMTDADLLARLASNPRISAASTFNTRAVAESSVAGLLNANAAGVGSWLAGSGSRLVLNGSHGVTGRSVAQGSSSISNVTGVRAVLVRDPNLSVGYRVQTAFPTP